MFLSKRNQIYYIYYVNKSGKRACISTKSQLKNDALKFLSNFKEELSKRELQKTIPITFKDFRNSFRSYSALNHSYKTGKDYQSVFTKLMQFTGDIQISNITYNTITGYLKKRREHSLETVSKDLRYLKCAFNWAVEQNYLLSNPCSKIKAIKIPEKQPLFFSRDEFQNLLDTIDNQDLKHIVLFAVNTGLRLSEILTLEWNQINLQDRYVILDNQNHTTKSKKIRSIALNSKALEVIIERQLNKNFTKIFTVNNEIIRDYDLSKLFKSYVLRADINPKLKFHSLRHTFASWLVQKGVSIYEVSKLLGHSDIRVTQIYAHLTPDNLRSAVELLN